MAWKIGILVALLCAALTNAVDQVANLQREHEYFQEGNKVNNEKQKEVANSEEMDFNRHNGQHKPYIPYSSEESERWGSRGLHKPHFPHNPQGSGEWQQHGFAKPHFPHSAESGKSAYHGPQNPNFPHHSGNWKHYSSSNSHTPQRLQELNSGYELLRPDWYNPSKPQNEEQKANFENMERRRPLFYPIHPYHPFYPHNPHGQPSIDSEEFETVDALRHKPIPFPYFHYLPMEPSFPIINELSGRNIQEDPNIDDDDDFLTSADENPYWTPLPKSKRFQDPFIVTNKDELQGIIFNILEHFHHSDGKPHDHKELKSDKNQEETDEEANRDEEIVPLSGNSNIPSNKDNAIVKEII